MRVVTEVHKDDIKVGDTIHHAGHDRTVCKKDIGSSNAFMGRTLFGESYKLGYTPVLKVTFEVDPT